MNIVKYGGTANLCIGITQTVTWGIKTWQEIVTFASQIRRLQVVVGCNFQRDTLVMFLTVARVRWLGDGSTFATLGMIFYMHV